MCIDAKLRWSWCAFQTASCLAAMRRTKRVADVEDLNSARFHVAQN
jgi:hypothetical protein